MKNILVSLTAGFALLGAAAVSTAPAQAQVGLQIGPGGVRVFNDEEPQRRVIERRRVIVEDEPECRIVVRRRTNEFGEVVERRRRVCD